MMQTELVHKWCVKDSTMNPKECKVWTLEYEKNEPLKVQNWTVKGTKLNREGCKILPWRMKIDPWKELN